jgi:hypothetical protein
MAEFSAELADEEEDGEEAVVIDDDDDDKERGSNGGLEEVGLEISLPVDDRSSVGLSLKAFRSQL